MKTNKTENEVVIQPVPSSAKPLTRATSAKTTSAKTVKPIVAKTVKTEPVEPVANESKPVDDKSVTDVAPVVKKTELVEIIEAMKTKAVKKPKPKVVRDSFTMPQSEYQKIAAIKELCLKSGVQVKKSEVLRAGVIALCAMNEEQLKNALSGLDKIKTGRPNKH